MRKLFITTSLMFLGFAGSALGQHRIVKLNSSQVQGQELKADSITVVWDCGEGRYRLSSILPQGPVQFVSRAALIQFVRQSNRSDAQLPQLVVDTTAAARSQQYLALPPGTEDAEAGDTILGYQTVLTTGLSTPPDPEGGQSTIHYSRELGMDLKIVTARGDTVSTSEAVSVDDQDNFHPRTVDLSGIEGAAAKAEASGRGDYAKQIRRLVRRWQRAAANWP